MRVRSSVAAAALGLLLLPGLCAAGSINIVPVSVTLDPGSKMASLRIANGAADKVALQVEAMAWSQDGSGQDRYEATSDLVFSPKILTIEGKHNRVVRLGFHGEWPKSERTYRLYLRELPRSGGGESGLKISLRLGVPVFVSPSKKAAKADARIESVEMAGRQVVTRVKNAGAVHVVPDKLSVRGLDDGGGEVWTKPISSWYVLPGSTRSFAVETTPEECRRAAKLEVTGGAGGAVLRASGTVDCAKCGSAEPGPAPAAPTQE